MRTISRGHVSFDEKGLKTFITINISFVSKETGYSLIARAFKVIGSTKDMIDKQAAHPQVQYLVLQVRYLRHIFAPNGILSLIQSIIQHHLPNITGNDHFFFLSFFVLTCRKYDLIHPLSIMQPIYKAFGHFGFSPDLSSLSFANPLLLPLASLFLSIPNFCHLRFLTSNFFIIDDATDRLRLRVRSKYPVKFGLCQRLYKDML